MPISRVDLGPVLNTVNWSDIFGQSRQRRLLGFRIERLGQHRREGDSEHPALEFEQPTSLPTASPSSSARSPQTPASAGKTRSTSIMAQPANTCLREINVTRGAGHLNDYTLMVGAIGGSSSTDLLKTGTGVLELTGTEHLPGKHADPRRHAGGHRRRQPRHRGEPDRQCCRGQAVRCSPGPATFFPGADRSVIVNPGGAIRGGRPVTYLLVRAHRHAHHLLRSDHPQHRGRSRHDPVRVQPHGDQHRRPRARSSSARPSTSTSTPARAISSPSSWSTPASRARRLAGEQYTITLATVDLPRVSGSTASTFPMASSTSRTTCSSHRASPSIRTTPSPY